MSNSNFKREVTSLDTCRFETPKTFYHPNQTYNVRPPFPINKRRMVPFFYPNAGTRPISRPRFRQNYAAGHKNVKNFNFQSLSCPPFRMPSPYPQSQEFSEASPKSVNRKIWNHCSSGANQNEHQAPMEYNCHTFPSASRANRIKKQRSAILKNVSSDIQNPSDMWVQALPTTGQQYSYNTRTCETSWVNSENFHETEFNENPCLAIKPEFEQAHITHVQDQTQLVDAMQDLAYLSTYVPLVPDLSVPPPPIFIYPGPSTVYSSPHYSPISQYEAVQGPNNSHISLSNPLAPTLFSSGEETTSETDIIFDQVFDSVERKQYLQMNQTNTNDERKCYKNANNLSDWSMSLSKVSLSSSNSSEGVETIIEKIEDITGKFDDQVDSKPKHEEQLTDESDLIESSKKDKYLEDEKCPEKKIIKVDKSRPISSTPLPNSSWCVVWTGDDKVFFYDTNTKTSVWDRPVELVNRKDVDKLVEKPILKTYEKGASITSYETDINKNKQTSENKENLYSKSTCVNTIDTVKKTLNSKDMSYLQRVQIFQDLLKEKNISVFSTWEKELHKMADDSRYLLLSAKERREVFENFIFEKMESDKAERRREINQRNEQFLCLIEEAGVDIKTSFVDFANCYGRDDRFKAIESMKFKENLFEDYISEILKMKETEGELIS